MSRETDDLDLDMLPPCMGSPGGRRRGLLGLLYSGATVLTVCRCCALEVYVREIEVLAIFSVYV